MYLGDLGKLETKPRLTRESEYKQTYMKNTKSKRAMTNLEELKLWKLETKTGTFMEVQAKVSKNFQVH